MLFRSVADYDGHATTTAGGPWRFDGEIFRPTTAAHSRPRDDTAGPLAKAADHDERRRLKLARRPSELPDGPRAASSRQSGRPATSTAQQHTAELRNDKILGGDPHADILDTNTSDRQSGLLQPKKLAGLLAQFDNKRADVIGLQETRAPAASTFVMGQYLCIMSACTAGAGRMRIVAVHGTAGTWRPVLSGGGCRGALPRALAHRRQRRLQLP